MCTLNLFKQILPLIKKQKVIHFSKTDTRLANNGLPVEMQKLRCKVNFDGLKFRHAIEELGEKIVKYLRAKGPFLVLHLCYEMDMLAFSGCTHGCTDAEADKLTQMRSENLSALLKGSAYISSINKLCEW
jgi:hypothetical protein